MNKQAIERYFSLLSRKFHEPCLIILTGAGAGVVYGRVRATMDLDFAVKLKGPSSAAKSGRWEDFSKAVQVVTLQTGIDAQYAEDIDRWSSITLLDYENHTCPFKRFGKIEVRLLDPCHWAIGKFSRYLDSDIRDLIQVLQKTKTPWRRLTQVLGKSLRKSPKSTACFLFRRQVEDFLSAYGRSIWGKEFSKEAAIQRFHRDAKIKP